MPAVPLHAKLAVVIGLIFLFQPGALVRLCRFQKCQNAGGACSAGRYIVNATYCARKFWILLFVSRFVAVSIVGPKWKFTVVCLLQRALRASSQHQRTRLRAKAARQNLSLCSRLGLSQSTIKNTAASPTLRLSVASPQRQDLLVSVCFLFVLLFCLFFDFV